MANELRIQNGIYLDNFTNNIIYPNILSYDSASGIVGYASTSSINSAFPVQAESLLTSDTNLWSTGPSSSYTLSNTSKRSIALGYQAGRNGQSGSVSIGYQAGSSSIVASNTDFAVHIGHQAGTGITTTYKGSIFIGNEAGRGGTNSQNSIFLGYQAGSGSNLGPSNIIIGSYLGLPTGFQNYANIGGVIFISGSTPPTQTYVTTALTSSRVGIGIHLPTATLHVSGTTNVFLLRGSGSSSPIATISGSLGNLMSVYDSTSGSVLKVADSNNNAYFEVFSDSTTLIGTASAPVLNTTINRSLSPGITKLYELPTASYNAYFVDYYASTTNTSNYVTTGRFSAARLSGSSIVTLFNVTSSNVIFGDIKMGVNVSASQLLLSASVITETYIFKAHIRAI